MRKLIYAWVQVEDDKQEAAKWEAMSNKFVRCSVSVSLYVFNYKQLREVTNCVPEMFSKVHGELDSW